MTWDATPTLIVGMLNENKSARAHKNIRKTIIKINKFFIFHSNPLDSISLHHKSC